MDKKENFMSDNALLYRAAIKYYDNRLMNARKFIKDIEHNIKQEKKLPFNKKGRFCKDI